MNIDIEQVSVEKMMNSVRSISKWERISGSEEEKESFFYLKQCLDTMGYDTKLIEHDAFISVPLCSKLEVDGEIITSRTHAMSRSTDDKGVDGELVYCEDLLDEEVTEKYKGKIIMTLGRALFPIVERGSSLGAVGMIFIQELPIRECIPSASWGSPTPFNKNLLPQIPLLSIGEPDGIRLIKKINTGTVLANLMTAVDNKWEKIPLLTGEIKADLSINQFVMFSGHVDSWYFGAIDNGTANAVQLETARIVAKNREKLKRNFRIVFFSGHSQGRYAGSAWYSDHNWEDLHANCVVNINADSLGGEKSDDITRSIIMPETKKLAVEIIKKQTNENFVGSRCTRMADQSFWNVGVSSAFASFSKQKRIRKPDGSYGFEKGNADLGWWWHTPKDTIDNVNPDNLLRDAKIYVEYVMRFLTDEILPLDFNQTIDEIIDGLEAWQQKAGLKFDLKDVLSKAKQVKILCRKFYDTSLPSAEKNTIILNLGRLLVPLNYTSGNIYENDAAIAQPPIPAFSLINELIKAEKSNEQRMEIRVVLTRKKNFANDTLNKAINLLTNYLSD
ncbi:MAG: M28 family peptidase [Lachnospiraceae bacterium]